MFLSLWSHRELVIQLIRRDVLTRFRGSLGGLLWLLLGPLLMLSLYTIVFGVFMKVRWPGVSDTLMYSLLVYIGLIMFNFFSECLNRSPGIIVSNPNFVTKVIFPLEIYPWVIVGTALFNAMFSIGILAVFCVLILGKIHLTMLLLPLLWLPLVFIALGVSWFLSSAGVFIRDIAHLMAFIMQILMYLSPVFYSLSMLPESVQKVLFINPLTFTIEQARNLIIFGQLPQWTSLGVYFIVSICVAFLGFFWFQKTKDGFADVL